MTGEESDENTQSPCRSSGEGMYTRGKRTQHGKPMAWSVVTTNPEPVTDRRGAVGWRRGPYY